MSNPESPATPKAKKKIALNFKKSKQEEIKTSTPLEEIDTHDVASPKISKLRKTFPQIPADDQIVTTYKCGLDLGKIPNVGTMYITTHWVLFKCNFPKEVRSIEISDIMLIDKKKSAMVLNNALEITTRSDKKYFFTSLVHRDETYDVLTKQRKVVEDIEATHKKEEARVHREKTADEVTNDVKQYNLIRKMKPVLEIEEKRPTSKCAQCTII